MDDYETVYWPIAYAIAATMFFSGIGALAAVAFIAG